MYIYVCTYICIYLCKYCRPLYHIHYNSTIKSHILLNYHIITQPSYYIYHSTYQDYTPCENYSQPIKLLYVHIYVYIYVNIVDHYITYIITQPSNHIYYSTIISLLNHHITYITQPIKITHPVKITPNP